MQNTLLDLTFADSFPQFDAPCNSSQESDATYNSASSSSAAPCNPSSSSAAPSSPYDQVFDEFLNPDAMA